MQALYGKIACTPINQNITGVYYNYGYTKTTAL